MQKFTKILVAALFCGLFSLSLNAKNIEVDTLDSKMNPSKVSVPLDPKRVAVIDMATLDTIDALGFGDRVVGMPKNQKIDYLIKYNNNDKIKHLGSVKEVNMEALMSAEPDVIFIGSRLASKYDELSKIAPVVYLAINYKNGTIPSIKKNIHTIAKIFNADKDIEKKLQSFDDRIKAINAKAKGKTAVIGLVTSSSLHTLGNAKRCAIIGTDAGFENLGKDSKTTHGNESSFELVVKLDPEYLFILDRDAAISKAGAKLASEVLDNELIHRTQAYKNKKIFYLTPGVWYLSEGGFTATDIMLKDIEQAFK